MAFYDNAVKSLGNRGAQLQAQENNVLNTPTPTISSRPQNLGNARQGVVNAGLSQSQDQINANNLATDKVMFKDGINVDNYSQAVEYGQGKGYAPNWAEKLYGSQMGRGWEPQGGYPTQAPAPVQASPLMYKY